MAGSIDPKAPVDEGTMAALLQRYENMKLFDTHRNSFMDDLMTRYQYVSQRLMEERAQFDVERLWAKQSLQTSQQNTQLLNQFLNSAPFVLVLIDGADLNFHASFLRDGDSGGRRCGAMLYQAINEYVFSTVDDLPHETKVLVRIYADLEELTGTCLQHKTVDQGTKIRSFVRGFVQDNTLFDIINVYSQGREPIIDKVEAHLNLHLYDLHCRHIILGCSDSAIYGPILKKVAKDETCHKRITLLSGEPLDDELTLLPFESTEMPGIFRGTRTDIHAANNRRHEMERLSKYGLPSIIGAPLGTLTPPSSIRSESRLEMINPRKTSVASSVTSSEAPLQKSITWASAAKKASALPVTVSNKLLVKEYVVPSIRRNKHGQRLDPTPPEYKRDEVNRIKKMKLCNAHYLRHDCIYDEKNCTHTHVYKCTKSELETLKLVARMSACIHDSECDDAKCIYGHNCPFPVSKEGSMRGKGCLNGENCRFPPHMHGQDMTAVKTTKVT